MKFVWQLLRALLVSGASGRVCKDTGSAEIQRFTLSIESHPGPTS